MISAIKEIEDILIDNFTCVNVFCPDSKISSSDHTFGYMSVLENILHLLDNHQISYIQIHHEPTLTSEDSARVRGEDLSSGAKAIVYKVQDEFCLFVLAADRRLDPKKIKTYFKSLGKRVKKTRFATREELITQTGLVPGSVPPFGKPILPYTLYIDRSLLANTHISFNAGSLTDSLKLSLEDYVSISTGVVVDVISHD